MAACPRPRASTRARPQKRCAVRDRLVHSIYAGCISAHLVRTYGSLVKNALKALWRSQMHG